MARQRNDEAELTRCVTLAAKVVDAALPRRPSAGPAAESDRAELRKLAFTAVLRELLDFES
jgi:hypothetical protein